MQASVAATEAVDDAATVGLARDLFAFVTHLAKRCNPDVFVAFGALELTLTQLKVLHHLERIDEPLTVKEAAELVSISSPAVSRALDDLVRRDLVERHEDAADRRMKRLAITDSGRAAIRRLNASRLDGLQQFVETLTGQERRRLRSALAQLLERPEIAACRLEDR